MTRDAPRPWRRRALRIALEIALVVAVYVAVNAWQGRKLLGADSPAPPFTLPSLDGRRVALADYSGKRVLLHFWATWCGLCRREHGALNAVFDRLGPDEALLSVVVDAEDPEAVRRYVAEAGIRYPVLLGDANIVRDYRVTAFPTNYFLTRDGKIAATTVGMSTRFGLDARLGCAR